MATTTAMQRHLRLVTKLERLPRPTAAHARLSFQRVSEHLQDLERLNAPEIQEVFTLTRYLAQRHAVSAKKAHLR